MRLEGSAGRVRDLLQLLMPASPEPWNSLMAWTRRVEPAGLNWIKGMLQWRWHLPPWSRSSLERMFSWITPGPDVGDNADNAMA